MFCPQCGTAIYSTTVDDDPKAYNVRLGVLRQRYELVPRPSVFADQPFAAAQRNTKLASQTVLALRLPPGEMGRRLPTIPLLHPKQ